MASADSSGAVMAFWAAPRRRRVDDSNVHLASTGCRTGSAATTAARSRARGLAACRSSTSGGSGSGSIPERIAPGHPEQNGSHEQFHAVLKADTARPPAPNCAAQQQRFRRFCREYNEQRPHEALTDQPPARCYQPSHRSLPTRMSPLDYPGHMDGRRVSGNGCLSWKSEPLFVATALAGEHVACEEVDDGLWTLHFATVPLARYDERRRTLQPSATFSAGRSASCAGSAPDQDQKKQ